MEEESKELIKVENYAGVTRITGVTKDILDLDKTFNCGQCFRWKKVAEDTYLGVIFGLPLMLKQMKFADGVYGIATTLTLDKVENILLKYLQLDVSYDKELNISEADTFATEALAYGKGIRILRQEPWEALVSFIISQRNNIPKISSTIERLCEALGDEVELKIGDKTYKSYTLPTAEKVVAAGLDGIQGLGLGYRDTYIMGAAESVNTGKFKLEELATEKISGDVAVLELQKLYGVGPKVANCVALFGLGKQDRFPIDIWMQRVIDRYYPTGIDIEGYGRFAGLVQQYMFYYIKNN